MVAIGSRNRLLYSLCNKIGLGHVYVSKPNLLCIGEERVNFPFELNR